jgi:hypothetical protein
VEDRRTHLEEDHLEEDHLEEDHPAEDHQTRRGRDLLVEDRRIHRVAHRAEETRDRLEIRAARPSYRQADPQVRTPVGARQERVAGAAEWVQHQATEARRRASFPSAEGATPEVRPLERKAKRPADAARRELKARLRQAAARSS